MGLWSIIRHSCAGADAFRLQEGYPLMLLRGQIVTANGLVPDGVVETDDAGRIAAIRPKGVGAPTVSVDYSGCLIVPGFVDLHVHGGGGADFMHGTIDAVRQVARTHARFGTTTMLAKS